MCREIVTLSCHLQENGSRVFSVGFRVSYVHEVDILKFLLSMVQHIKHFVFAVFVLPTAAWSKKGTSEALGFGHWLDKLFYQLHATSTTYYGFTVWRTANFVILILYFIILIMTFITLSKANSLRKSMQTGKGIWCYKSCYRKIHNMESEKGWEMWKTYVTACQFGDENFHVLKFLHLGFLSSHIMQ